VAQEITQETLVAAVEGIARYNAFRATLWAWLCGIAVNKRREFVRDEARQQRIRESFAARPPETGAPPPDEKARDLLRALTALHPHHQKVLTLKYLQGLDVKSIAQQLGQSDKAIESRLTRARESLRHAYEKRNDELSEGDSHG
jgi:RNA polymerase sigma-70 factor (ECF subfamily)